MDPSYIDMKLKNKFDTICSKQVAVFKAIYETLYHAQLNHHFFKSNFMKGKETLSPEVLYTEITAHVEVYPHSRTATAWQFAQCYFEDFNSRNLEMMNALYAYALENTTYCGIRFFLAKKTTPAITAEKIEGLKLSDIGHKTVCQSDEDTVLFIIKHFIDLHALMIDANTYLEHADYQP
jgi:hypothetical protein